MLAPTTLAWNPVARWLHWGIALLIAAQVALGWVAEEMERGPAKIDVMVAHKSLGVTVALLAVVRLAWRWTHPVPPPPAGSKGWEIWAARLTHGALYLLLIAVPVTGWMVADTSVAPWNFWWLAPLPSFMATDKELHEVAEELHELAINGMITVLALHIAAALYHHLGRRDDVLLRMLGRS